MLLDFCLFGNILLTADSEQGKVTVGPTFFFFFGYKFWVSGPFPLGPAAGIRGIESYLRNF